MDKITMKLEAFDKFIDEMNTLPDKMLSNLKDEKVKKINALYCNECKKAGQAEKTADGIRANYCCDNMKQKVDKILEE